MKTIRRKNRQIFLADLAELSRQELATNGERRKSSKKAMEVDDKEFYVDTSDKCVVYFLW
jgi:hypothetical protein